MRSPTDGHDFCELCNHLLFHEFCDSALRPDSPTFTSRCECDAVVILSVEQFPGRAVVQGNNGNPTCRPRPTDLSPRPRPERNGNGLSISVQVLPPSAVIAAVAPCRWVCDSRRRRSCRDFDRGMRSRKCRRIRRLQRSAFRLPPSFGLDRWNERPVPFWLRPCRTRRHSRRG